VRLIKLSIGEFPTGEDVNRYFRSPESELRSRTPRGTFVFPKGWIAKDGLNPGDTVLFSYRADVIYVGRARSGRQPNAIYTPRLLGVRTRD